MYFQKIISKKIRKREGSEAGAGSFVRGTDPRIRIRTKMSRIRDTPCITQKNPICSEVILSKYMRHWENIQEATKKVQTVLLCTRPMLKIFKERINAWKINRNEAIFLLIISHPSTVSTYSSTGGVQTGIFKALLVGTMLSSLLRNSV